MMVQTVHSKGKKANISQRLFLVGSSPKPCNTELVSFHWRFYSNRGRTFPRRSLHAKAVCDQRLNLFKPGQVSFNT